MRALSYQLAHLSLGTVLVLAGCKTVSVPHGATPGGSVASAPTISAVWVADQGDGTYKNPVLHADYSDPDVVRVGRDYYLTASSFQDIPGLPILHSHDLVNWQLISYALPRQQPAAVYDVPQHGYGVWAPCLRYHDGQFYLFWGDPDYGIYLVRAPRATGPWSAPTLVLAGKGLIDPAPFWDDDGRAYLVHAWAGSRAGVNSLLTLHQLAPDGTHILDAGRTIYSGHSDGNHTIEGPKLYKRSGYYYILAPAGGVATGWELALRSRSLYGPWETKRVLSQGTTVINGPHQGGWVTTPDGREDWFVHFQDKGPYGRVLHLQPMRWQQDWPVIGDDPDGDGTGQPVLTHRKPAVGRAYPLATPPETDEFNADSLGRQWQWQANDQVQWAALVRGTGYLRLFAVPAPAGAVNLWPVPSLLLQKFPAPDFTATTKLTFTTEWDVWAGKKAGLLVMGSDYAYLAISQTANGFRVTQVVGRDVASGTSEQAVAEQALPSGTAYLRVHVSAPEATCRFSYSLDGQVFHPLGQPFPAKPEKWVGAKVGLFCTAPTTGRIGGYADVDWFRITP